MTRVNEDIRSWMGQEQRIDRRLRRFARLGWSTAVAAVVIYGAFKIFVVIHFLWRFEGQTVPRGAYLDIATNLMGIVYALGALGLLGGVLATIGSFVRFRAASLEEIQLRLAAIEEAILDREGDST